MQAQYGVELELSPQVVKMKVLETPFGLGFMVFPLFIPLSSKALNFL